MIYVAIYMFWAIAVVMALVFSGIALGIYVSPTAATIYVPFAFFLGVMLIGPVLRWSVEHL